MATRAKTLPHEKGKGEAALSDFADYVEKQQALRYPSAAAGEELDHHDELEAILDSLNLSDGPPRARLRDLLLGDDGADGLAEVLRERLAEGHGETVFDIGFENSGASMRLSADEWRAACARLEAVARRACRAECQVLLTRNVGGALDAEGGAGAAAQATGAADGDASGKVMVRQAPRTAEEVIETRIAVVGNVDAGKSSMLGVLVKGDLDDGRGKARVNLFRHKHEMETGRTSSVGMEIMGFDAKGQVVTSDVPGRKLSWEEIGKRSAKGARVRRRPCDGWDRADVKALQSSPLPTWPVTSGT